MPQIRGMHEGDRSRKITLVEHGFRLPSALDNRPLRFDEFEAARAAVRLRLGDAGRLRAARVASRSSSRSSARPASSTRRSSCGRSKGQIDDLIAEIKERDGADERVLVTTLTKKMAEDLTDYLFEQGIRVRYLHSDIAHARARRDPARPARGRVRRASSASTCCARGSTCPRSRSSRSSTPTRKASCATSARSSRRSAARRATSPARSSCTPTGSPTRCGSRSTRRTAAARCRSRTTPSTASSRRRSARRSPTSCSTCTRARRRLTTAAEAARELAKLPRDEVMRLISTLEEDMARRGRGARLRVGGAAARPGREAARGDRVDVDGRGARPAQEGRAQGLGLRAAKAPLATRRRIASTAGTAA